MNIENWEICRVKPYGQNPRVNAGAVDAVAASIQEFGFRQPIVVDQQGVIIVGHTRWKAAKQLGLERVPVHVAQGLSAEQVKAYRLADNKTAELADWDSELLGLELDDLNEADFDLGLLGFSNEELEKHLGAEISGNRSLADVDLIPQAPDQAITQRGDLWLLGEHRLLCGDSASVGDLDRLLDGQNIQLVNTDPPYNVKVEPRSNNAIAAGHASSSVNRHQSFDLSRDVSKGDGKPSKLRPKDRPLENDFLPDAEFDALLRKWFGNISRVLEPGRAFYIWGGYANCANYPSALRENELYFSQAIIWVKEHPVLTRKDFMGNHEWCFYGWREGKAHYFNTEINNATDVWSIKKVTPQSMVHLTEKPVELAERAIGYSSKPGENVLDLFGGSGSTLMACEKTGRKAFLMEIDPLYCDVIVNRYEQAIGHKAERISMEVQS